MQSLLEQIVLSNKYRFGRHTEKLDDVNQMCFTEVDEGLIKTIEYFKGQI